MKKVIFIIILLFTNLLIVSNNKVEYLGRPAGWTNANHLQHYNLFIFRKKRRLDYNIEKYIKLNKHKPPLYWRYESNSVNSLIAG